MSLSIDGVWKAGVWATTCWADGVWREGAPPITETPIYGSGGRIYPILPEPKRKKGRVERQPLPEYEVSGPLSRDRQLEQFKLPEWDQEAWEAGLKTLAHLEAEQLTRRKKRVESMLVLWLLH